MGKHGSRLVIFLLPLLVLLGCGSDGEKKTASDVSLGESGDGETAVLTSPSSIGSVTTVNKVQVSSRNSVAETSSSDLPLVIFDTDMGPDIDDALALAMLHGYESEDKIELAAVTVSRDSLNGAKFSDVLNTFYGKPDIPVGFYNGTTGANVDHYAGMSDNYPHDLNAAIDGYKVQRQILADAEAEGRKVIMIQVGFSGNISKLLDSEADDISPKSGIELVEDNVLVLSIMAGQFGWGAPEFNVKNDLPAAKNLFAKWPVKLAVSGWSVGGEIFYPYSAIEGNLEVGNPVRDAYEYKQNGNSPFSSEGWHQPTGAFYNMRTWDLTSVLEAVEPEVNYFDRSGMGTVTLDGAGVSTFAEGTGEHYILSPASSLSDEQREKSVNRMIALIK